MSNESCPKLGEDTPTQCEGCPALTELDGTIKSKYDSLQQGMEWQAARGYQILRDNIPGLEYPEPVAGLNADGAYRSFQKYVLTKNQELDEAHVSREDIIRHCHDGLDTRSRLGGLIVTETCGSDSGSVSSVKSKRIRLS